MVTGPLPDGCNVAIAAPSSISVQRAGAPAAGPRNRSLVGAVTRYGPDIVEAAARLAARMARRALLQQHLADKESR